MLSHNARSETIVNLKKKQMNSRNLKSWILNEKLLQKHILRRIENKTKKLFSILSIRALRQQKIQSIINNLNSQKYLQKL